MNQGNNHEDLPLVLRPSSALAKTAPGAKRILSAMVADALALGQKPRPLRIIVLDDEPMQSELYVLIIRDNFKNATVLTFADGDQAWQEMLRTAPDLLIMDMNRRGLDGATMLPLLARNKVRFPILVMSGSVGEEGVRKCAGSELNISYLPKPYGISDFINYLEIALKTRRDAAVQEEITSLKIRSLTIILVDFDNDFLEIVEAMILDKFKGITVQTFQNGNEAWQELQRADPDLLITTDVIPGMRGEEIVRRVVEREATYPILVVSAWEPTEQWVRGYAGEKTNISFLKKPFTAEQLYSELAKHFSIELKSGLPTKRTRSKDAERI